MPQKVTRNYYFGGRAEVLIYSEAEMAAALGISRKELVGHIAAGRLCYHAHPSSGVTIDGGYDFNPSAYRTNIARWKCLQSGGHRYDAAGKCAGCGAEKYD